MRTLFSIVIGIICTSFLLGCGGGGGDSGANDPPSITQLTAIPQTVAVNGFSTVTCSASDPDGDQLAYNWSATAGLITGSGASINWQAPGTIGNQTIYCTVSDGALAANANIIVTVTEASSAPQITNFQVNPQTFDFHGGEMQIQATITDDTGIQQAGVKVTYPDSSVVSVDMSHVGSLYSADWTAPVNARADGQNMTYSLKIVARDINGNETTSTNTIATVFAPEDPPIVPPW